jgi:hypothetical protein
MSLVGIPTINLDYVSGGALRFVSVAWISVFPSIKSTKSGERPSFLLQVARLSPAQIAHCISSGGYG